MIISVSSMGSDKIRLLNSRRYTTHDATQFRYAGSLTPRHKSTVCGDDEYAPIDLGISILSLLSFNGVDKSQRDRQNGALRRDEKVCT